MLTRRIRAQAILLSVAPLAFLLLLLMLAIVLESRTQDAAMWSEHSSRVLDASDAAMHTLRRANGDVVSYTTTHDPAELAGYRRASAALIAQMSALRRLVADDPTQEARAAAYASAMQQGLGVLQQYLRLTESGRSRQALALGSSSPTRTVANRLTASKAAFDQTERELAIVRFDALRRQLGIFAAMVVGATLLGIVVTLFTTARFGLRIVRRLSQLAQNAQQLGAGEDPLPIEGTDEIADLDNVYRALTARLRREHRVASTLQRALLPHKLPAVDGVSISTAYLPASQAAEVGGDWYDAFVLSRDRFALCVGDVAGHGLPAATIMGAVRQGIRTAAREDSDPSAVLGIVNRLVCAEAWEMHVTAFFAVLDMRDGTIAYAAAGHPPPFIARSGEAPTLLPCEGLMLGVDPSYDYRTFSDTLSEGAMLVLYTDGLIESERDILKGTADLARIVAADDVRTGPNPAEEIQRRVFEHVSPQDDSAVLAVRLDRLRPENANTAMWEFDAKDALAARRVRQQLGEFMSGRAAHDDFSIAELIFGELAGNAAKHTNGAARCRVERNGESVVMYFEDCGPAFTYCGAGVDPFAESGRGLFLVHALAAEVLVEHCDGGNRITVTIAA